MSTLLRSGLNVQPNATTRDYFRETMEQWDREHEPQVALHPDSIEWDVYQSDRERFIAGLDADEPPSDIEWLELQAEYLDAIGSDAARLAARTLSELAAAMEAVGCWDAQSYSAIHVDAA
jgi:hypothetical protein